jgi:hypothetical protein
LKNKGTNILEGEFIIILKYEGGSILNKDHFELFLVEAAIDNRMHRVIYTVPTVPEAYEKFMGELKGNQDVQKMKSLSVKKGTIPFDIFK